MTLASIEGSRSALTTTGHSHIWEVSRGFVTEHDLNPVDLGIPTADISSLLGSDPEHNAAVASYLAHLRQKSAGDGAR